MAKSTSATAKKKRADDFQPIGIIELRAENLKPIKAVVIPFKPVGITDITGANGSGKSTVLDVIWWTIAGKGVIDQKPIRDGQVEGSSTLTFSNGMKAHRTYKLIEGGDYTTSLKVTTKEGAVLSQSALSEMIATMGIDPLAFARMEPKKRREFIAEWIGIDIDQLEADEKLLRTQRTNHFEYYELARRQFEARPALPAKPEDLVDITALNEQFNEAVRQQRAGEELVRICEESLRDAVSAKSIHEGQIAERETNISKLNLQILELQRQQKEEQDRLHELQGNLPTRDSDIKTHEQGITIAKEKLAALPSVEAIQTKIAEAGEKNKASNNYELLVAQDKKIAADWQREEAKRKEFDEQIEAKLKEKVELLTKAKFPVEGLGFEDNPDPKKADVTYKGQPFGQSSTAQQIQVGMAIAMEQNPDFAFITCYDGSLCDSKTRALIEQLAIDHKTQVIMEGVDESGEKGIFLIDGEVGKVNA